MVEGGNYRCNLCKVYLGFEGAERGVGLRVVSADWTDKQVMVTPLEGSDFHLCNRCHECVSQAFTLAHPSIV